MTTRYPSFLCVTFLTTYPTLITARRSAVAGACAIRSVRKMNYFLTAGIAALVAWAFLSARSKDTWLRRRNAHHNLWQQAFTSEQWIRVDEALCWICSALLLPLKDRYALRPSDSIWSIYRHYYPTKAHADNMEMETLYMYLEEAGHDPSILSRENITVRDIVVLHAGLPQHST